MGKREMRKFRIVIALVLTFPLYFAAGWMRRLDFCEEYESYARELVGLAR